MITEFPLLVFTVLTGIAAGAYVGAALFPKKGEDARAWVFPLVALILVAVGGLSATAHLGRPAMMMNVLNNPAASLTMEGLSAGALAAVAIVDLVLAWQAATFSGLGAAGAACIAAGGVIAAVAAIVAAMARSGKMAPKTAALAVAVIAIVALVVSRYGFYMASVI